MDLGSCRSKYCAHKYQLDIAMYHAIMAWTFPLVFQGHARNAQKVLQIDQLAAISCHGIKHLTPNQLGS